MANKIINYDVYLKSTKPSPQTDLPKVYTNDLNSVSFEFKIKDFTSGELTGATASTLLYMRDGSFFQNTTGVTLVTDVFKYTLKENEGNHDGLAKIQLVVKIGTQEFASQLFEFGIVSGLESKVAQEVMIQDWTTLTAEAQDFVEELRVLVPQAKANHTTAVSDHNTALADHTIVTGYNTRLTTVEANTALKATNLVTNGDFSNGSTGWTGYGSTLSVDSNELSSIGDGTVFKPYIRNTVLSSAAIGDKFYARATFTPNASLSEVSIHLFDDTISFSEASITNLAPNVRTTESRIFTSDRASSKLNFALQHKYADNATANGKVLKVKFMLAVNLTAIFGAGNEPTKTQMDNIMNNFPYGNFKDTAQLQTIKTLSIVKANKLQEPWITPTFTNGWVSVGGYVVAYRKNDFGTVELKGYVSGGTTGAAAFTLPSGYRPTQSVAFLCATGGTSQVKITIGTDGTVKIDSTGNTVNLDSVRFYTN